MTSTHRTPGLADDRCPHPGPFPTVPNVVTAVRTVVSVALGVYGLTTTDPLWWIVGGYAVYWLGDSLDGLLARRLDQETRAGGVHDIVSDRACTGVLAAGLLVLQPDLWPAIVIFLINFMVLDTLVSLSFLLWPIVSPNYFGQVDARVHRYNWSHPAKAINNLGIVAAVVVANLWLALGVVLLQIVVKLWTAREIIRLIEQREAS